MALTTTNWLNLAAFIVNLVITNVSNTGIFGSTISAVSEKYQTVINPAGWAFSIWGLIFLTELICCVAQLTPRFSSSNLVLGASSSWWIAACVFQTAWTPAFVGEVLWLSMACMFGIWISLFGLVMHQEKVVADMGNSVSTLEYLLLVVPFRIHFGWITTATVLNVNILVVKYYADSADAQLGVAISSVVLLGAIAGLLRTNHALPAVLAWGIGAIASELSSPMGKITLLFGANTLNGVKISATIVSILLAVYTVAGAIVGHFATKKTHSPLDAPLNVRYA